MRERILTPTRYSFAIAFTVLLSAACAPATPVAERDGPITPLLERRRFVDLPDTRGTLTAQQKREFDNARRLGSHIRQLCAEVDAAKHRCIRFVNVLVTAVEGAKYVKATELQGSPQLIAWIENLGREKTLYHGLLPAYQARYALVVNSDKNESLGSRPQLVLVEIRNPEDHSVASFGARIIEYGHVYECHMYRQPYLSDVDIRRCDLDGRSIAARNLWNGSVLATSMVTLAAQFYVDDPTWFSCDSGCCTSANPRGPRPDSVQAPPD